MSASPPSDACYLDKGRAGTRTGKGFQGYDWATRTTILPRVWPPSSAA